MQEKIFDLQARQLRSEYLPRVSLFVQGAYGRPTLNIINNTFDFWYLGGVRLQWSLTGLYAQGSRRHLFELNKENTRADRETFLFNTQLQLNQQDAQQQKLAQLITQDEEVVTLRRQIAQAAQVQLDNGVITTTDYLQKVNAEQLAKQMLILHQIQLLQAQENSKILSSPSPSEGEESVKRRQEASFK